MNVKSDENTNLVKLHVTKVVKSSLRIVNRPLHQLVIVPLVFSLYSFRLSNLVLLFRVLFSADIYPAVVVCPIINERMDKISNPICLNIPACPLLPLLKCSTESANAKFMKS